MSFPSGAWENLEKMGNMAVLCDFGFDIALDYMTNSRNRGVDWSWCTSLWFLYDSSMVEETGVPSGSASSTHQLNSNVEPIGDLNIPAYAVFCDRGP